MSAPQAGKDEIVEAIRTVVPRVAAAVRSAPDASKVAVGRWTIGHVAAHLASSVPYFESLAAGDGVPVAALSERSDWNEQALAPLLDEPLDSLADAYEAGLGAVVEEIAGRPVDREVPWVGGIPLAMTGVAAIVLCEALVHGHDVSAGKGWEKDPAYARQALLGLVPTLPLFITEAGAKLRATFELSEGTRGRDSAGVRRGNPVHRGPRIEEGRLSHLRRPVQVSARRLRADIAVGADPHRPDGGVGP